MAAPASSTSLGSSTSQSSTISTTTTTTTSVASLASTTSTSSVTSTALGSSAATTGYSTQSSANGTIAATIQGTTTGTLLSSASAPAAKHYGSRLSTSATAGIAVGCVLGGILIGLVAAWLLFQRRNRTPLQPATTQEFQDGGKPIIGSPLAEGEIQLDQFLLDATPDEDIKGEMQALGDLIAQHVENHYHLGRMESISVLEQALLQLGFSHDSKGVTADAIAAVCLRSESWQIGLRHVISQVIFRSIDIRSPSRFSMLPAPVAGFLQSMPRNGDPATSLALSKWRRLSAFLLHPDPGHRTPLPVLEPNVLSQAQVLGGALNTFLHYFVAANEADRNAQTSHMLGVIIECTKLGYVLLSQPQDWQFVFDRGMPGPGLVVCPGLDKLSSDSSWRREVEPSVVGLNTLRS